MESKKAGNKKKAPAKSKSKMKNKKGAKDNNGPATAWPSLYKKEVPKPPEIIHVPAEYKLMDKK